MSKFRTKFNPRGSGNRFRKSLSKVSRGKQVFINIVEEEPTPEPVDKSQLISIIEYWDTSSSEYPPENYTPESYQAVLDAYSIAVAVRDDEEATQEEVDTAHLNLLNAISGLEEVPIEPEDCVYPLDVSQEQLDLLGVTTFDVLDSCYNKFTNPTYKDSGEPYSWALRKEYVDALMIGADVPSEYLIPRGQAFEVVFRWDSEDKINGDIGVIELFGDGSLMGGAIRVISSLKDSEVVAEIQQIDGSSIDIVPQVGFEELRFGVLYEEGILTVKSNIAIDEVIAVDWDYLGMFISQNTPALKMTFEFITKAKDLTFPYPEGTKGLDGELVGG